ncbi:hypothetical protein ACIA5D_36790 [Actinoplanes sp. NPDC051513]|uniref:hypothetical protein n=1 Tax=Actinoplanes sp. NPDC051513 TaxID=3363908 RepID=UPI0037A6AE1E
MADRRTWQGAIRSPGDARRLLDQVNAASVDKANMTALATAVQQADEVELRPDATRFLPVDDQIAPLLPWPGLPRGATVGVVGSTNLLLALIAGATKGGGWAACVGLPHLGLLAAIQEHRIPAERLALVPNPGPDWPQVVAALIDGVDLVAVGVPGPVADGTVRSLQARAREKGCVLVPTSRWPAANTTLEVTGRRWEGLGHGRGRLKRQTLEVTTSGRGAAARPRRTTVTFGEPVVNVAAVVAALPPLRDELMAPAVPATPQPEPGLPDPWADLLHHLPRIERKRPYH